MHRLAVCIACLLVLAPRLVPALELGPIDVRSALYEPLDARIPIRSARSGDLEGLNVVLGSPAQFELAGVARLHHLDLLEFIVVEQGDGGGYIHVRTEEPVIEPSLTFLIDVDWPRGRTVRGYRLRLSAAASRAADASPEPRATPEMRPEPETGATRTATASGATRYGPVGASETLWSIATRLRPDKSVSVQRMMLAIVEANPNAFVIGNINGLHAGVMLRIPGRDEIGPDDPTAAIAEVQAHHSAWSEHRKRTPVSAAPSTPTPATPDDTETEPGGRIEVVSPEIAAGVIGQEEGAEVEALRKELALAMEEADAGRRENDELKLRLSEAEEHVRELNRLVELKNEEIAALQADLKALTEATPPAQELPPLPDAAEAESTPTPTPTAEESKPAAAPDEAEPAVVPVPAQAAGPEPAMVAEVEPKPLPFGLGALPVNPVFLVGGAGLLLLLLGVLALLRRWRASAGEDDVLEVAEASSPEKDDLLFELEAVAAELADEPDVPPRRAVRDGPAAVAAVGPAAVLDGGAKLESPPSDVARPGSEGLVGERIAQLWHDEGDADAGTSSATDEGVAWSAEPAAERSADFVPDADDDIDDSGARSQALLDESADGGETDQFSLEEFGEGGVQTKIDLAQVYMEMGDTESARGFLEAVLAEGDAEQQEIAREMLSKLA